jgi:hypothetical protein
MKPSDDLVNKDWETRNWALLTVLFIVLLVVKTPKIAKVTSVI